MGIRSIGAVLVVALAAGLAAGCGGGGGPYVDVECRGVDAYTNQPTGCVTVTYPNKPKGYGNLPYCTAANIPQENNTACLPRGGRSR